MAEAFTHVSIDGQVQDPETASIPVGDMGFVRGYGVFEVIRSLDGRCVRMADHLERLARSAAMLGIGLPEESSIRSWVDTAVEATLHVDGVVRVMVTAGDDPYEGEARVVVTTEPAPAQEPSLRLGPIVAPWHSDGESWELLRAKTLSYANNFGARRAAKMDGFDDALLVGRSGRVLEGPTFSVGWVVSEGSDVIYETPALELGILDSITRSLALDAASDAGLTVREVSADLDGLGRADEFFVLSTLRDAVPVTAVGDRIFASGPHTEALRIAMAARTASELDAGR